MITKVDGTNERSMPVSALLEFLSSDLADEFMRTALEGVVCVSRVDEARVEVRCESWAALCRAIDAANEIDPEEP